MTIVAMLDANVCIRVLRQRPAEALERFEAEAHTMAVSTIVDFELVFGAERSARRDHQLAVIESFIGQLAVYNFDRAAAAHAADIRADLTRKGKLIGPYDLLIAGHARSRNLKLITGNLREFSRVEGLRCEDWF